MQFGGSLGVSWFFLFLLAVLLIVILVMLIGSVVVAAISLSLLLVLPAVRHQFVALTEQLTDTEVNSLTNRKFVAVYEFVVLAYGITLLVTGAALANNIGTIRSLVPVSGTMFLATGTVGVVGLLLVGVRYLTGARWRTLAEWIVFLSSVAVLTVVAAFAVPYLLFTGLSSLI